MLPPVWENGMVAILGQWNGARHHRVLSLLEACSPLQKLCAHTSCSTRHISLLLGEQAGECTGHGARVCHQKVTPFIQVPTCRVHTVEVEANLDCVVA
jgi:hypothetical protein